MEIKDIYDKYSTEQIDEFEKIAESKCCWGCKKRNKSCSDCELFLTERDNIVICDYIEYLAYKKIAPQIKGCLDREIEKDQRIAELEKEVEQLKEKKIVVFKDDLNQTTIINGTEFTNEQIFRLKEIGEFEQDWFKKYRKETQRIAVLEKALELACVLGVDDIRVFNEPKEECVKRLTKYYIEQAEKELGDKE